MVGVLRPLIRMKLTVVRHSMGGTRGILMATGAAIGLLLAAGTIWLATLRPDHPTALADVLAVVFAMWTLGWVLGPLSGGGTSVLRASHFALLPISRLRLAVGLLGAAFVAVTTAITFLALASLVVYAVRLGAVPTVVALPAVLLQLAFVVLLSRVVVGVFGAVVKSRLGGLLSGVTQGVLMVAAQSGWMVIVAVDQFQVLSTGFPRGFSAALRALPSSWGLVAVQAADRSDWLLAAGSLAGLAAVVGVLLMAWSRILGSPRTARVVIRGSRAGEPRTAPRLPAGGTGAVVIKELRAWWRDPVRWELFSVAPAWALITALLPLAFGETALLPWAAPATALMAAAVFANSYGRDGTALWLILLTPGAERQDVRGRQWAWLAVFAPATVLMAAILIPLSGEHWTWPWMLALLPALLGGGAGLMVWVGVTQLVPGPDPHRNRANPLEGGESTAAQGLLVFFAGILPAVPAAAMVRAGMVQDNDLLLWGGVPVGIATGVLGAWLLGRIAYSHLEARGPELLYLMRTGRSSQATTGEAPQPSVLETMTLRQQFVLFLGVWLGSIALFPQGLVPLGIKLSGGGDPVWFLPLYLPQALQWPAIAVMVLLGLGTYGLVARIYLRRKSELWRLQRER